MYELCKYYKIRKEPFARGSFSSVYYGIHREKGYEVAIKRISTRSMSEKCKSHMFQEIEVMKHLKHPNILYMYDSYIEYDIIYIVTEYCNNGSLSEWFSSTNRTETDKKDIIYQLLTGLSYLHSKEIAHRDLKPQNILFHSNNKKQILKICDFGFSTILKDHYQMMNTMCGTPLYMSPEILLGNSYTMYSDIWSFGILSYEIFFGEHPYQKPKNLKEYCLIIQSPVSYPKSIETMQIVDFLQKCLHHDPSHRLDAILLLQHPYFSNLHLSFQKEIASSLSVPVSLLSKTLDSNDHQTYRPVIFSSENEKKLHMSSEKRMDVRQQEEKMQMYYRCIDKYYESYENYFSKSKELEESQSGKSLPISIPQKNSPKEQGFLKKSYTLLSSIFQSFTY